MDKEFEIINPNQFLCFFDIFWIFKISYQLDYKYDYQLVSFFFIENLISV